MYSKTKIVYFLFIVLSFISIQVPLSACDLVLHDWQLRFYYKFQNNSPLIPLSEISIIQNHFKDAVTDKVLWVTKPSLLTPFMDLILSCFDGWVAKTKWYLIPDNKSLGKIAKNFYNDKNKPLIIDTDKNEFKICLFSDLNADNRCYQLVLAQESRIRCIFQDPNEPWAQEFKGQSCFSIVFYQQLRPENIISVNLYPINNENKALYEDVHYVEHLLNDRKLKARPELYVNPHQKVIPELPD